MSLKNESSSERCLKKANIKRIVVLFVCCFRRGLELGLRSYLSEGEHEQLSILGILSRKPVVLLYSRYKS